MKADFNKFLVDNPTCSSISSDAKEVFNILSKDENIINMIEYSENNKPALAACIPELEAWNNSKKNNAFSLDNDFNRQAIGRMVKTILEPFGYEVSSRKSIQKAIADSHFSTATCYKKTGMAKLKVVKQIVEI